MQAEMTIAQVCEYIAETELVATGRVLDPETDVFNCSPTGELWPVVAWYERAKAYREKHPEKF